MKKCARDAQNGQSMAHWPRVNQRHGGRVVILASRTVKLCLAKKNGKVLELQSCVRSSRMHVVRSLGILANK